MLHAWILKNAYTNKRILKNKKNDVAMQQMPNQLTDTHISVKVFAVRAHRSH